MYREGPIITEPQYICDVCGRKKPVSQMAGKCVKCGRYVCSQCAKLRGDRVYCSGCAGPCFIATAAYGTSLSAEIDTLRRFRDEKLNKNLIGKYLVMSYYTLSPPLANIISRSERMRALVRSNLNLLIQALKSKDEHKRTWKLGKRHAAYTSQKL